MLYKIIKKLFPKFYKKWEYSQIDFINKHGFEEAYHLFHFFLPETFETHFDCKFNNNAYNFNEHGYYEAYSKYANALRTIKNPSIEQLEYLIKRVPSIFRTFPEIHRKNPRLQRVTFFSMLESGSSSNYDLLDYFIDTPYDLQMHIFEHYKQGSKKIKLHSLQNLCHEIKKYFLSKCISNFALFNEITPEDEEYYISCCSDNFNGFYFFKRDVSQESIKKVSYLINDKNIAQICYDRTDSDEVKTYLALKFGIT